MTPVWIWTSGWLAGAASAMILAFGLIVICFWPSKEDKQ